jgi:adenylate cyclase
MIRRVRLITGCILFTYVTSHLLNHMLGLVSYAAMEEGRLWFIAAWRNPVGTTLLYGSLIIHFLLALWAIYERRELKFSFAEAVQLCFGIAIPLLLVGHIVGTRGVHQAAGTDDLYALVLLVHFKFATQYFYYQTAGLFAAWVHGCMGIYYWLRLKPWFPGAAQYLFAAALLVPVVSLLGYIDAGREVVALYEDPGWRKSIRALIGFPDKETSAFLQSLSPIIRWSIGGAIALALVARIARALVIRGRGFVCVTYPDGSSYNIQPGVTLLEASNINNVPHASVCGGRGRCSTCRVRVTEGIEDLPAASAAEARVLERIGSPPMVRLACQTRPIAPVSIIPLLPPTCTPLDAGPRPAYHMGEERQITILFADLRDFTRFSERKLPYDVVFVLNRYFANMGSAVEEAGGYLDKFIGDGVMALFGVDGDADRGARQSLDAARLMSIRLDELNHALEADLEEPLRIGIGIHAGPAIIGELGYGKATSLTAVGDAVNTASRLEAMTKEHRAQLVVSDTVAGHAGVDLSGFPSHQLEVRGRSGTISAHVIINAQELPLGIDQRNKQPA